jgi:hypothetical protein
MVHQRKAGGRGMKECPYDHITPSSIEDWWSYCPVCGERLKEEED